MGAILSFRSEAKSEPRRTRKLAGGACEIVIFPGVRIERHHDSDLDLGHRLRDSAGSGEFDGIGGGGRRPRKRN